MRTFFLATPAHRNCNHPVCTVLRLEAAQPCRVCGQCIGHRKLVTREDNDQLIHADCLAAEVDREHSRRLDAAVAAVREVAEKNRV